MASQTQRSRIADDLLNEIKDHTYAVGDKLPSERLLAEKYGVSRPVIREALGMLMTLDVIDIQMGRGAYVTSADVSTDLGAAHGLIDIIDAREAIESGAIRLAAVRADETEREIVSAAVEALKAAVDRGSETSDLDLELHFSLVRAAKSPVLAKLWGDMTSEIAQTIRVSPHGRSMNSDILADHVRLADGVLVGDLDTALAACAELYDEHRQFLHSLLG